jgi:hypothetical protein
MIPISNPSNHDLEDHYSRVGPVIITKCQNLLQRGYVTYKGNDYPIGGREVGVLTELANQYRLERIVKSHQSPIIQHFDQFFPEFRDHDSGIYVCLRSVFYGTYSEMDKWRFINYIKPRTCFYCNRGYTYSLTRNSNVKAEIDHFFPKALYPFLAVTFYNLIPSCSICNGQGGKHDKDPIQEALISPYMLDSDDFKFKFQLATANLASLQDTGAIELDIDTQHTGNTRVFKLKELYQKHTDHIAELIYRAELLYTEEYQNYLLAYEKLDIDKEEINRLIIGNYTEKKDLHKRPLAKMYRDISIDLGLIQE